jgi:imidazolonepropionase-like amidohydrolase
MDPRLKYVPAAVRAQWESEKRQQQASEDKLSGLKQLSNRYLELVHAMHRAGVPFMTGTDGPQAYVYPGFSLHEEMELLVKSGFTNADALAAATFYPALFMVKLDQYGVIEPGRVADMVLLDANPLDDIRNTRRISAVILGGKYYSRSELDKTLAQVAQAAGKQDVMAATR